MEAVTRVGNNFHYLVAVALFVIGFHTMLTHANLIKKIMGMNIMDTAVFLLFISSGYVRGGHAPILAPDAVGGRTYVNPVPAALILTGIVIAVSITAFALGLIVRLYRFYGTLDADEIAVLRSRQR
jgi:multicomponent Na+:H+ antiporter subunit C